MAHFNFSRKSFPVNRSSEGESPFYQQLRNLSVSSLLTSSSSSSCSGDISPLNSSDDQSPTTPNTTTLKFPLERPLHSHAEECRHCSRQGRPLFCFSCGFWMANGRVAQPCARHPNVIFYTDFAACPKCKKPGYLRELD